MNTRRQFIRGAAGGAALFNILPRALIAGSGATPPSETVRVASIGAGGRAVADIYGLEHAGAKIVALCDVDQAAARASARSARTCRSTPITRRCSTSTTRTSTP